MSDNKKYYYMRLKENFFDSEGMVILEGLKNGYIYSNILLKMYLRSLKRDGKLMLSDAIPYDANMLSKVLGHKKSHVEEALEWFQKLELAEVLDNGAIYMLDIQNFIGEASTEADRKRGYRRKIDNEKNENWTNVRQMSDKYPPETETEKEKKIDTETETNSNNSASASVSAPATASLFSLDELLEIVKEHKVNLTKEGVKAFYEEMRRTGWTLYKKKVEPDNIVKSLRGYSKYNGKYHLGNLLNGTRWKENAVYDNEVDGTNGAAEIVSSRHGITFVKTESEEELIEKLQKHPFLKCAYSSSCKSWYIELRDDDICEEDCECGEEDDDFFKSKGCTESSPRNQEETQQPKETNPDVKWFNGKKLIKIDGEWYEACD